jgi:hypothetical protein
MPQLHINGEEILANAAHARASACKECEPETASLIADIAKLLAEIDWLYQSLRQARLQAANLEAAIRATLGAHADGETDPLAYLRGELAGNSGGDADEA